MVDGRVYLCGRGGGHVLVHVVGGGGSPVDRLTDRRL